MVSKLQENREAMPSKRSPLGILVRPIESPSIVSYKTILIVNVRGDRVCGMADERFSMLCLCQLTGIGDCQPPKPLAPAWESMIKRNAANCPPGKNDHAQTKDSGVC